MMLGTLLGRLECETDAAEALAALGDITLFAEVAAMAERHGETPAQYIAFGAARFASQASDSDWLGLIAAMDRAGDPGEAALSCLARWSLAHDAPEAAGAGCSCGGHAA